MADAAPTTDIKFQNFFSATLTGDITSSTVDIVLDAVPNGSEGFLVIEPDSTTNREIIYFNSKTALKVVCPDASTGRGQDDTTAVSHSQGATVIMAPVAAYFETLLALFNTTPQGWTSLSGTHSVASGYNKGNRSFVISTSADHSAALSPGMRYKVARSVTPPTQCADLEASSTHYASKSSPSGITFTDDFTCEAWIKPESYGAQTEILSRYDGSTGFLFRCNSDGTIQISGVDGSGVDYIKSHQSVPLGEWTHVVVSIDISANSGAVYFNGALVPSAFTGGGASGITQAGNLVVSGYGSGTNPFDGKIADVRLWSDARTATEIKDNMYQQLVGNETNLVAYFELDGDFTDETANNNDLTAQNSAVATNVDNPFNATEYGVITAVSASEITVFTPSGTGIPNETLATPFYSTQDVPFGFPRDKGRWVVDMLGKINSTKASPTNDLYYNISGEQLLVPIGAWYLGYTASPQTVDSGNASSACQYTLGTSASAETDEKFTGFINTQAGSGTTGIAASVFMEHPINISAADVYYLLLKAISSDSTIYWRGDVGNTMIHAKCAYV